MRQQSSDCKAAKIMEMFFLLFHLLETRTLHLLDPLEHPDKRLRILRPADFVLPLQHEVGHPAHAATLGFRDLPVHLLASLVTPQPVLHFRLVQAGPHARLPQHVMTRNIALLLKVGPEQLLNDARLHVWPFAPAQRHQPMAVPRVARLAAETKLDPGFFADGGQALDDHVGLCLAELGVEVGALVDAGGGRGRVQVEGLPGRGEGVRGGRVRGLVEGDAALEFFLADVAPGADVVRGYGDVEFCHFGGAGLVGDCLGERREGCGSLGSGRRS